MAHGLILPVTVFRRDKFQG